MWEPLETKNFFMIIVLLKNGGEGFILNEKETGMLIHKSHRSLYVGRGRDIYPDNDFRFFEELFAQRMA